MHHVERHRGIAAFAEHRLDDDRGNALGLGIGEEEVLQPGQRVLHGDPVAHRRERRPEDIRREGAHVFFVGRDLAGHAQRQQGAAMVAAGEGDDARTASGGAGNFHGVLNGFGAGGDEQRLFGCVTRGQRVQFFSQFDVGAVGHHLKAGVGIVIFLRLGGFDHFGVAVAGVQDADAPDEIDVAVAFDIPQFGILGVFRIDRRGGGHTARHGGVAARDEVGIRLTVGFGGGICFDHCHLRRGFGLGRGFAVRFLDGAGHGTDTLLRKREGQ